MDFTRAWTDGLPFSLPHAVRGGGPGRGAPADAHPTFGGNPQTALNPRSSAQKPGKLTSTTSG
jgi:hypothetical protein